MPAAGSKRGEPRGERKATGYLPPRGPTPASMAAMQWNPSDWPFRSREELTFPEALPLHRPGLVLGSGHAQAATVYLPGTSHAPGAGARACKPILFSHNHVLHLTGHSQGRAHVSPSDWGFLRWKGCYHHSEKGSQGGAVIFHLSSSPSSSSGVRAAILSPSLQAGRRLLPQVTSIIQPGHSPVCVWGGAGGEGRASWA